MVKSFVDSYPENVQEAVYRFAELDGVNRPGSAKLARIREDVKKKLFPNSWRSDTRYFMTKAGVKYIIPKHLKLAILAYKNGGTEKMPTFTTQIIDVFSPSFKRRKVTAYKYGETTIKGQHLDLGVSGEQELMMYVNFRRIWSYYSTLRFQDGSNSMAPRERLRCVR